MAEILIVDDERIMRDNLRALFEGEGYKVCTAANGEHAVERFEERRPDLVLMDAMMPKMNGYAAVKRMREIDRRVPVVFLTAKDSDADEMHALALGAHDFISKSAECGVLLMRVKRALERTDETAGPADCDDEVDVGDGVSAALSAGVVMDRGRVVASLTPTESNILRELSRRRGAFISVDALIAALRGSGYSCEDNMLYAHISNLRRKLGAAGGRIGTERGRGYRLSRK